MPGSQVADWSMDLQAALTAFHATYQSDPREGLTVTPQVEGGVLSVRVRHQDGETLRGFDVVAEPLASEERGADDLGRDVAEVVERELAHGQLSATDEAGQFKRIVV